MLTPPFDGRVRLKGLLSSETDVRENFGSEEDVITI
jgi:hypothetical protein